MRKTFIIQLILSLSLGLSFFQASATTVHGDLNDDGAANIQDVTFLIDRLLAGETVWTMDVNADGKVSIADVTDLIHYLLSGDWPWSDPVGPGPDDAVTYTVNGYPFVMVPVKGGTFMMGSEVSGENASPILEVTLSDFSIGMTEVTMGLWKAVTGSYPFGYNSALDNDNSPVWYCSWDQARAFIDQLNELTGLAFHLPSEAQWEFAARGGNYSHGYKYAGSDDSFEVAWDAYKDDTNRHHTVAQLKPNELGLYDMSGNVMEFCMDDYEGGYIDYPLVDPVLVSPNPNVAHRSIRGGSYLVVNVLCTVTTRKNSTEFFVLHGQEVIGAGFRLAL